MCSILVTGDLKMHNIPWQYPGLLEGSGMKCNTVAKASRGDAPEKECSSEKQAPKSNEITTMSKSKLNSAQVRTETRTSVWDFLIFFFF